MDSISRRTKAMNVVIWPSTISSCQPATFRRFSKRLKPSRAMANLSSVGRVARRRPSTWAVPHSRQQLNLVELRVVLLEVRLGFQKRRSHVRLRRPEDASTVDVHEVPHGRLLAAAQYRRWPAIAQPKAMDQRRLPIKP
eukprot:8826937-Pyramimonas_sp.AAC.1